MTTQCTQYRSNIMTVIERLVGKDKAMILWLEYGGRKVAIPEHAKPDRCLCKLIGVDAATAIVARFRGQFIEFPSLRNIGRPALKTLILDAVGQPSEIARKLGCTARYVRMVLRDAGVPPGRKERSLPLVAKERVLAEKGSVKDVAERLGCSADFVRTCRRASAETGKQLPPRPLRERILAETGPAHEIAKRLGCAIAHVLEARGKGAS